MDCRISVVLSAFVAAATVFAAADIPLTIDTGYSGRGFYRYCPSVVGEGGVRHVFYCRNQDAYRVVDHIYHATVSPSGEIANETIALSPDDSSGAAWDSYHVCDPSVIAGRFWHNGRFYRYLMAYLGVRGRPGDAASDGAKCVNNKVGFAVSDSLDGGWTRMGADCVVKTATPASWGVGQPSVVSLDGAGKVALFYSGDYGTRMLVLDFGSEGATTSSLCEHIGDEGAFVSTTGIGDLTGVQTSGFHITNGDFAWNRKTGCLYLAADTPDRPDLWYDDGGEGLSITKAVTVYRAAIGELTAAGVAAARWERLCRINPDDLTSDIRTNFRIHNAGLLRGLRGELAGKTAFVSVAHLEPKALYTYRFVPVKWGEGRDWFEGGLGQPKHAPWGGEWSPDIETVKGALVLDGPDTRLASFRVNAPHRIVRGGCVARISADMTFEADGGLPPVDTAMKAALAVYDGSYWGLGVDPDGGASNVWRRLEGKAPALDTKVLVDCEVFRQNGRDWVSYAVDGETLGTFGIHLEYRTVSSTEFCGIGTVSSLVGTCDGDQSDGMKISIK